MHAVYKGNLRTILLKILADKRESYGYEIVQTIKTMSEDKLDINEGALYPLLHKLEVEGILTTSIRPVDNRLRKYYTLTPKGIQAGKQEWQTLQEHLAILQRLLNSEMKPT